MPTRTIACILALNSVLLIVSQPAYAQFWQNDVRWLYLQDQFIPTGNDEYLELRKTGDTTINDRACIEIQQTYLSVSNTQIDSTVVHSLFMQYDNKRVYQYDDYNDVFALIYDFSLMPGDTLQSYCSFAFASVPVLITAVDTIAIGGQFRIRQMVMALSGECYMEGGIIEGIGWSRYLLPRPGFVDPPPGGMLLCYEETGTQYPNEEGCSILVSLQEPDFVKPGIYPNPTADFITFEGPVPKTFGVYSISGDLVLTGTNQRTVNLRHLADGLYLLRLLSMPTSTHLIVKESH